MRYYNAVEASRELNISDKTIRRWVKKGKISAKRTQFNEIAIPESEIDRLRLELGSSDQWVDSPLSHPKTVTQDRVDTPIAYDIEQRIASLAQSIANLNATIASQTRRIDELSARVAELEAKQSLVPLTEKPHTPLYRYSVDREESQAEQPQFRTTQPSSVPADIPPDAMPAHDFAEAHNVPADLPLGTLHSTDFAARLGLTRSQMEGMLKNGVKGERLDRKKIPSTSTGRYSNWFTVPQQEQAMELLRRHGKIK